jgi:hypothetical protein
VIREENITGSKHTRKGVIILTPEGTNNFNEVRNFRESMPESFWIVVEEIPEIVQV